MINLAEKNLPNTIEVGKNKFSINTDFRVWIEFSILLERWDRKSDLDFGFIFKNEIPLISSKDDIDNIMEFFASPNILPKNIKSSSERVLDYEIDGEMIYAAFLQLYNIDLFDIEHLHWHKFKALLSGVTDSTKLGQVMGYRCYDGKDREYNKLKRSWELPKIIQDNATKKKQIQDFNEYFN